ncbi:hypothetical protein CC78DRAFT_522718 [Lojkania enalia]|uniref:DNA-directed RNA polymerase subunit n=1 Tax=Lojkania enalia TaxID=147567 RepID=A0A9P4K0V0_9PLEO|nr:hypothetical protein CC78DRAFT_522718 [Didymosphaeria enalia]
MAPIEEEQPSLLHIERISQYVSIPPSTLATPLPSLCASILSPLLLSYYAPARGIVLAYENQEREEEPVYEDKGGHELLLKVIDEYSAAFLWATADFLIWRPRTNAWIEGRVTHQSSSHITLSHLNAFPVSVLNAQLPRDWEWCTEAGGRKDKDKDTTEGYWVDGDGLPVQDVLRVRVREWDFSAKMGGRGFVKVEGSLLREGEDKAPEKQERGKGSKKKAKRELRNSQRNGEAVEVA